MPIIVFDAHLSRAETLATANGWVRTLSFTGDGAGLLATTHDEGGHVLGLRVSGGQLAFSIPVPVAPSELESMGDGRAYVMTGSAPDAAGVAIVLSVVGDPSISQVPVCHVPPLGLALGPDEDRLYTTCPDSGVVEVDLVLRRRVRAVPLSNGAPAAPPCDAGSPVAGSSGAVLFIPCRGSGVVLRVDRVTLRTLDAVDLGVPAIRDLAGGPSGALMALADGEPSLLVPLDRRGRPSQPGIALPAGASRLALTAKPSIAYVVGDGPDGGWLAWVDLGSGGVRVVPIPAGPAAVAVWPNPFPPVMWFAAGRQEQPGSLRTRAVGRATPPSRAARGRLREMVEVSTRPLARASLRLTAGSSIRFPISTTVSSARAGMW